LPTLDGEPNFAKAQCDLLRHCAVMGLRVIHVVSFGDAGE
jgi:hypothetical protein